MADILAPFGAHMSNEPHEGVVAFIQDLLDQAKRGEIHGIATAYVVGQGKVITDWEGGRASQMTMLAAVSRLLHRVHMTCDDDD